MRIAPASAHRPGANGSRSVRTRPPTRCWPSRITGSCPARMSSCAATRPDMPAPITTTRDGSAARGWSPFSRTSRHCSSVRGITAPTLLPQRAGFVEPFVECGGARVAAQQHVLDGAADASLLAGSVHDLAQEEVGLAPVVLFGVRVHLEVLDLDAVVVAHPLVPHL